MKRPYTPLSRQQGVVLPYVMIALLILLIGALAALRSLDTSLSSAGHVAFKRDLVNQGEHAVAAVMARFAQNGPQATDQSDPAHNYSAIQLEVNDRGIPKALLSDSAFAAVGSAGQDITATANPNLDPSLHIRYVVDRLCTAAGPAATQGPGGCVWGVMPGCSSNGNGARGGGSVQWRTRLGRSGASGTSSCSAPMYRLSMRVSGPRATQVFLQASFAKPE
jgi:hypothetical protein